ncbi:hypothetical protein OG884_34790 [Streptosporangium sp. NBC_01755]|nr:MULTISPECIES: hypothetical protein [unclassified Streptosporangium]WSA28650.1 hypothetical protein OIE13_12680 [Streptosporangium sp. NBC_01810]WSC99898.1 hypothetical protein OG884_34790 [Streptosporangium sp. NBC_01755]
MTRGDPTDSGPGEDLQVDVPGVQFVLQQHEQFLAAAESGDIGQ